VRARELRAFARTDGVRSSCARASEGPAAEGVRDTETCDAQVKTIDRLDFPQSVVLQDKHCHAIDGFNLSVISFKLQT